METLFIGKNIIFLPEIHSTNSYAIDLLKNVNLSEGTVVHTANQTHGKGQRGSVWNAQAKRNLTASIILKPTFLSIKNQFFLYQIVALACYDSVAEIMKSSQIDIKIKWPNDILVNKKKIAGILIENNIQNNQINWCVTGIGINVNQVEFDPTITATSLKLITGSDYSITLVLETLCKHFEKHYLVLRNSKLSSISEAYLKHLYGLNQFLEFEIHGERKKLLVKGLSESGLLLLEDSSGKINELDVKEVKWFL
ncbi:biotin--[acetyl-CoA-carboxylase] ligase [Aurantibacillus circumpalustris]|uniref:biotin--[acetyl-CoA-carboxylase] ligase n=1 Tax=Aurantibacillus circumpalustris TaxID=3036359 RepID=UPI00295B8D91|nr:biotin--[acetyl-CoA-carboxylase] ligase [Aurantibacillus circumpalustris]